MKYLVSRQNPTFKRLLSLAQDARERRKQNATLLDGPHLVEAALANDISFRRVAVAESALHNPEVAALLSRLNNHSQPCDVHVLTDSMLREISPVDSPVGIVAEITQPQEAPPTFVPPCDVLVLDGIQDPGNLGTILRTARAVGLAHIWLTDGCAHAWAPKVLRAAMGAHFGLIICEHVDALALLQQHSGPILTTAAQTGSIFSSSLKSPTVWLFGSEGLGVSASLSKIATQTVSVPMAAGLESLNVAVATAVCLYEQYRQRNC